MMEKSESSELESQQSFFRKHWNGWKDFWVDRFSFLENHRKVLEQRPSSWSSADVEEFIASDPVQGPVLKTAREAASYGVAGSVIGAVTTAGMAYKYSRSLHGAALSFGAGAFFGWTFGHEIANHRFQLYRLDTMAAEMKFFQWLEAKSQEKS